MFNQDEKQGYFWHFSFMLFYACLVVISIYILSLYGKLKYEIPIFDFIIAILAIFRLTHLFVYDRITDFIRDYFLSYKKGLGKSISELLHCPWCVGIWISLGVGFFYFLIPLTWYILLLIALAGGAIIIEKFVSYLSKS